MPKLFVPLLLTTLAACVGDSDPGVADPPSGAWHYSEYDVATNACNIDASELGQTAGDFWLTNNNDGTFTVVTADGTEPFDCTITGRDFFCPERHTENIDFNDDGIDAMATVNVSIDGSFPNDDRAVGTQDALVHCDGAACSAAAAYLSTTFPCLLSVEFSASPW